MVYCVKCGAKNDENAEKCAKCGASLYSTGGREHYRRVENECFGIPRGGTVVALAIGAIIIMAGLIPLMQQAGLIANDVQTWPFAVIVFGILMIIGALYALQRRY